MPKAISIPHKKFIDLVAAGENFQKAYTTICNKKTTSINARSQGSKLAKRYAKEITTERNKLQKAITDAHESDALKSALKSVLTKAERLEWLTKLVNGEIKSKVPFVIGGKIMEYQKEPDHNDRIKAIAELNKMDGSYAATKNEIDINQPFIFKVGYGEEDE